MSDPTPTRDSLVSAIEAARTARNDADMAYRDTADLYDIGGTSTPDSTNEARQAFTEARDKLGEAEAALAAYDADPKAKS